MRKKIIAIIIAVLGVAFAGFGISAKMKGAASVGIIVGADGPTAIFVAGNVGDGFGLGIILLGIMFVVVGVLIYRKMKKKYTE